MNGVKESLRERREPLWCGMACIARASYATQDRLCGGLGEMGAREMWCEVHLSRRSTLASWLAGGDARFRMADCSYPRGQHWPPGWQGGMRGSGWLIAAMQGRQVICTWVLFFSLLSWGAATGNCQSYGQPIRMVDRAAELAGCVQAQENSAMKGECKKL